MADADAFPQVLTVAQLRFEIVRGFQQIPRSVKRDMLVKDRDKAERAEAAAIAIVLARFEDKQVRARIAKNMSFADIPR